MKLKPAEFARQAGVTRQAVGAKIKNHTLFVDEAGFLDTENPVNTAYITEQSRKGRQAPVLAPAAQPQAAPIPGAAGVPAVPGAAPLQTEADIAMAAGVPAELLSMTLRQLVMQYSGLYGLEKHAKVLRDLTMAAEKEQRMQERGLKLIEKDFVTSRLFQYVDVLMKQLVEYPEATVDAVIAKVLSDGPASRPGLVIMLRDGLGRIIAGAKDQIIKELNGLKGKYTGKDSAAGTGNELFFPKIGKGGDDNRGDTTDD
jgi:hypothetical protein